MKRMKVFFCIMMLAFVLPYFTYAGCGNIVYFDGDVISDDSDINDGSVDSSGSGDANLSIRSFNLSIAGTDEWEREIDKVLYFGRSFQIEGEARIRNKSGSDAEDADIDYRIDHGRNFDRDDTKIDEERKLDIDGNETITKHMGRTTVTLSNDGKTVTVYGPDGHESFDVVDGVATFYIFVDVENDDDDDISSSFSGDNEYGVVHVIAKTYDSPKSGDVAAYTMRFYNSQHGAHFYSINPEDQTGVVERYSDWAYHGTSFIAFPDQYTGTVPLYTCWSESTHGYDTDVSRLKSRVTCKENPWRVFNVFPVDGPKRKPNYLMYKKSVNSYILSNGIDDAHFLRDKHGFDFVADEPLFWSPESLDTARLKVLTPAVLQALNNML